MCGVASLQQPIFGILVFTANEFGVLGLFLFCLPETSSMTLFQVVVAFHLLEMQADWPTRKSRNWAITYNV